MTRGQRPVRFEFERARAASPRRSRAFTLLEVLLAVAVAAVVLVAINGIFFGALRLRNKTTQAIEESLPLQRALGILERDLANLVPPGGALSGTLQTAANLPLQQGQVGPEFCSASAILSDRLPWSEVQRVAYLLVESTNGAPGRDLYRAVTRNLLQTTAEMPRREWILGGVEDLAFRFHDGSQWRADWDSTAQDNPLPRAIKVELQMAAPDLRQERPPPIELVVPFLMDGRTNTAAASSTSTNPGAAP